MSTKKALTRSNDGLIGGVIKGLAEYWGMDVNLLRAIYIFVSIISAAFPGTLFYILLWIIFPRQENGF